MWHCSFSPTYCSQNIWDIGLAVLSTGWLLVVKTEAASNVNKLQVVRAVVLPASELTYCVSGGALNSTHSLSLAVDFV